MKGRKSKTRKILLCLIVMALLLAFWELVVMQEIISVSRYECREGKCSLPFKVVHLSDLHSHSFGKDNSRLLRKIRAQEPDMILMTGDMVDREDERQVQVVERLVQESAKIAPVYFSLGNHEVEFVDSADFVRGFVSRIESAGAVVLDKEYVDTEIAGQEVRIGGLYGYALPYEWGDGSEQRFLEEFQETDRLKLLLCHMPIGMLEWGGMEQWDVDVIFSGHVHGGQVRIPFVGGLIAPEEGWLPKYTKGVFEKGNSTLVLSAGLGGGMFPRINNLPDLVVCTIRPE